MSAGDSRASPKRSSPSSKKKKTLLSPLKFLKSKDNYVGAYDYFSDDDSFEDLPLGIHGRGGWSYDFDDSDDSDDGDNVSLKSHPPPSSHSQIYFHTNFEEEEYCDTDLIPKPCTKERHLSALEPRPPSPPPSYASNYVGKQVPKKKRTYEADSDTSGTVETVDEDYDDPTYTLPKKRTIRWSDEAGKDLKTVYITERDKDDTDEHLYHMRIIVLLLNPKKKQFEFLHLTTPREERTHILQAVRLFPDLASDGSFHKQKYMGLCRPMKDGQELINSLCLQDYDLDRDEILVAIPSGMKGKEIVTISQPLLQDRTVQKMVRRKMRSGFAVQSLPHAIEAERVRQQEKDRNETTSNEPEHTIESSREKNDELKRVDDTEVPVESRIETRQNSDGSDEMLEETRSEEIMTETDDDSQRDEASQGATVESKEGDSSEVEKASIISTASSSVKATPTATGTVAVVQDVCGKQVEGAEDSDEMKQITLYIDELQRDIASEMESILSSTEERKPAFDVFAEEASEYDDDSAAALFGPVEDALNDALYEFHATAIETKESDDTLPGSLLNPSMDTNENEFETQYTPTRDPPLTLFEAMEMVSSVDDVPTKACVSPANEVSGESTSDVVEVVEASTVSSDRTKSYDVSAPDKETTNETPSHAVGDDGEAHTADDDEHEVLILPISIKDDANHEVSLDDHDGSTTSVASPVDADANDEKSADDESFDDSRGDEDDSSSDEDHEGYEHGAFPVFQHGLNVDHSAEAEDFPATSTSVVIRPLEKGLESHVHANAKHIASGSFYPSSERSTGDVDGRMKDVPPNMDDGVVVEVDELKNVPSKADQDEEKKGGFISLQIWNAAAIGLFVRRKKTTTAQF